MEPLEKVIEGKIKPIIDEAMVKYLGITVEQIKGDISDTLKQSPLLDFLVDTRIPFKKAKEEFRRQYLLRMLLRYYGNVSLVAKHAGLDRRSIHRMIDRFEIDPNKFREEMLKISYVKEMAVSGIIEGVIKNYEQALNKDKLDSLYDGVDEISKTIVKELPESPMSLDTAEKEFERKFIRRALEENDQNISQTAKAIGIRFETLHRKMKAIGVSVSK